MNRTVHLQQHPTPSTGKPPRLTYAQAQALGHLLRDCVDTHGAPTSINPIKVYPQRDNVDNANRRTITRLAELGLLVHDDDYPAYALVYRLNLPAAEMAYTLWYERTYDKPLVRCRFSDSGGCELSENPLAAAIHGNEPGGDHCRSEGGPWFCYLETK